MSFQTRSKRYNLYENIDPNHDLQSIGYKYLVEERGIELTKIPASQQYKLS